MKLKMCVWKDWEDNGWIHIIEEGLDQSPSRFPCLSDNHTSQLHQTK